MTLIATERVIPHARTAQNGEATVNWPKSVWLGAHCAFGLAALLVWPSLGGALVFLALTTLTICAGHLAGMHRLLIHRSVSTRKWLEHLRVLPGTLVGRAGQIGMIQAHDQRDDPVYRWIQRGWVLLQLPLALALFAVGGIGWVAWGISLRIAVSLIGHWTVGRWAVGHFAHRRGRQGWRIAELPVQVYDLRGSGLRTFTENCHGNRPARAGLTRL